MRVASFDFCINAAVDSGKITKKVAQQITESDNPDQAISELAANLTRQKREAAIQAVRLDAAWKNIESHPKGKYEGLMALMTKDPSGKAPYMNAEYLGKIYSAQLDSMFAEAMSKFRTRRIGFEQDEVGLRKLVKAIYGESIDDAEIAGLAGDWHKVTEKARTLFNERGGSISKNEKWLLPQNHDMQRISSTPKEVWIEEIKPFLDRNNMTDDFGNRLSDEEFEAALDYTYDTITTGGLNKAKDFTAMPAIGKKMARKGSEQRFLYFKDADSWIAYQSKYGRGDIFTTLTGWIDAKANDIAMMEVFGTNPNTAYDALKNQIEKELSKEGKSLTQTQRSFSDRTFSVISGQTNEGNLTSLADFMTAIRNLLTASTLGSAFLSSLSDIGTTAITTAYNGMGATKVLARQLSLMNPANEADRVLAVRMGLIAEAWKGRAHSANRYADVYGTGVTAKIAEGVMRASLLSPWTDAGRKAFGMEFGGMLADNFGKSLDELDSPIKKAFSTYGITEADWNTFRKTKPLDHKGAKFADMTQEGGTKFHQMILSEMDFAVPTPDARVKAITTGGTGRGTVAGQAWRSVMMLKSFPITIASTHFYRAAYQSTAGGKAAYVGAFVASATVLGGLALQVKDLAAGREPRPADNLEFFSAAMAQGGGLGIFGDFLFSDVNRFGGGPISTAFGPTGELFEKSLSLTVGNVQQAIKGEETNVLGEAASFAKRYTPDVWQTRLFTDALYDQMLIQVDDRAQQRYNRIIRKRQKDYDQGYWWRPGEPLPEGLQ